MVWFSILSHLDEKSPHREAPWGLLSLHRAELCGACTPGSSGLASAGLRCLWYVLGRVRTLGGRAVPCPGLHPSRESCFAEGGWPWLPLPHILAGCWPGHHCRVLPCQQPATLEPSWLPEHHLLDTISTQRRSSLSLKPPYHIPTGNRDLFRQVVSYCAI